MIIQVIKDNPIVLNQTPVLLDFYATWCGPCKLTKKNLEEYCEEHPEFTIYKIDVDECEELTEKYNVQSLPTLIYVNSDGEIWRHNGLMTKQMLIDKLS